MADGLPYEVVAMPGWKWWRGPGPTLWRTSTGIGLNRKTALPGNYRAGIERELGQISREWMTDGHTPWARPVDGEYDPEVQLDQAVIPFAFAICALGTRLPFRDVSRWSLGNRCD